VSPAGRLFAAFRRRGAAVHDGPPLPPRELRSLVAINLDDSSFVETGRREARMISDTLARQALRLEDFGAILDFGCGCGRVVRHWQPLAGSVQIHGSDYNKELVEWCRGHLRFAHFAVNPPGPPLVYHTGKFDFVSAFSVFTHLSPALQEQWVGELSRVLKPRGHLLFTTHGQSYAEALPTEERAQFDAGGLVVLGPGEPGTNQFKAFHPPAAVAHSFGPGFELIEHTPGVGAYHDVWLARKRDEPGQGASD
jgi:SAM-dependent methyltransferase